MDIAEEDERAQALVLPPTDLRMGGEHFLDDDDFVQSAIEDVRRLEEYAGLNRDCRLLDWGCGAGRLAVGVKAVLGHVREYHGVDVQPQLVEWAIENLSDERTRFSLVPSANARYNPEGSSVRSIPAEDGEVDVFYAYSVFSHMVPDEVAAYARIISRILAPHGRALVTAFVEEDVQAWQENPSGYGPIEWSGPLHCVRYDRGFLEDLLRESGLYVDIFEYGRETDGQSLYVLRPAAATPSVVGARTGGERRDTRAVSGDEPLEAREAPVAPAGEANGL